MSRINNKTTSNKITNSTKIAQPGRSDQKVRLTTKTSTVTGSPSTSKGTTVSKNDPKKDEEKKRQLSIKNLEHRTSTTKPSLNNKSSPSTTSILKTKPKLASTQIKTNLQTSKQEPLKAKRDSVTINKIKNLKISPIISKPNLVKDTYHNVTVASPPPIRKKQNSVEFQSLPSESEFKKNFEDIPSNIQQRRRTVTLEPDEVVMLKQMKNEVPQNVDAYFGSTVKKKNDLIGEPVTNSVPLKEPVAFEINFEDEKTKLQGINKNVIKDDKIKKENKNLLQSDPSDCICSDEYEDDFESYESDFESGSSSAEAEEESDESSIVNENIYKYHDNEQHNLKTEEINVQDINDDNNDDEDSEETHPPITVIHRQDKETERKLDSGNYDLKSANSNNNNKSLENQMESIKQQQKQYSQQQSHQQQPQLDSLETTTNNSDRLDSGIGTNSNGFNTMVYYSKENFMGSIFPVSSESKRGQELMKKIKLDEISYHLFELKPMNYEYYMKVYGNLNTLQTSTQTNENLMNTECQTDEYQLRSMWTQHPPHFDSQSILNNPIHFSNNINTNFVYCGEGENFDDDKDKPSDKIQTIIKTLDKFKKNEIKRNNIQFQNQKIDFDKLNQFLNRVKMTVFEVLNRNSKSVENSNTLKSSFSNGYKKLNSNFLNALRVIKIFSKVKYNFILTIHESTEDIYKNEFENLIVVWSTSDPQNPIRLLSTWSQVSKVDICTESTDIIVSGLKDGSIAMWDLRETYSYCSKLDGYLSHFAASQSIVPIVPSANKEIEIKLSGDLGSVVDIKSFKPETGAYILKAYKQIQFVSLNDTGILTIWSLIEIDQMDFNIRTPQISNIKTEFSSPWARVKLVQSAICDLRSYLELKTLKKQTKFEQTILYFENEIFDDQTLQELQKTNEDRETSNELQGLRFTTLDTSSNMIYIATNRNFIIVCSKTLKSERFRKIHINESVFMFPTAIRLHPNEEFLLVGLSNGSVVAINCNQNKTNPIDSEWDTDDTLSSKSNSESIDIIEMKKIQSSCAIQNMIRNERKIIDEFEQRNNYFTGDSDYRPRTAISEFEELDNVENPFKQYKMFDQQVLLNGTILRKNLVDSIEISMDGRKLYCLSDGNVKIYDFLNGSEIKCSKDEDVKGICLTKAESNIGHYIILLKSNNIVEIHKPKN